MAVNGVVFFIFMNVLNPPQNDIHFIKFVSVRLFQCIRGCVSFEFHVMEFGGLLGQEFEVVFLDGFGVPFLFENVHGDEVGDWDGLGTLDRFLIGLFVG